MTKRKTLLTRENVSKASKSVKNEVRCEVQVNKLSQSFQRHASSIYRDFFEVCLEGKTHTRRNNKLFNNKTVDL